MGKGVDHDLSVSNEELLELCRRQDQEALRVLLRRHERPVYSMLYRMLSCHEDAEEALAEVFVKVWRAAGGFKGDCSFTTWLYKIAANTARDTLRARRTRQEVAMEDVTVRGVELLERIEAKTGDPLAHALAAEDRDRLLEAITRLSEDDRLLVTLYHFRECDYSQIEQITGIPAGNLKVKLFRARQRLRKALAEMEMDGNQNEVRPDTTESSGLQQGAGDWA